MMKEPNEKQFSAICFLILMNHHKEGIRKAHPDYIEKKLQLLDMGYDAWGYLDIFNQKLVEKFLKDWGYRLPKNLDTHELDEVGYLL